MSLQSEFLATTVDPFNHNVLPPNVNNINSVTKDISIYASTTGINSGAVVWLPERSVSSLFTVVPGNGTTNGLGVAANTTNCSASGAQRGGAAPGGFAIATVQGYHFMYDKQQVNISPNIGEQNFTAYRTYAGQISAKSDTVSTGSMAITGELHATSVSDIRGLRQLRVPDLVQQSSKKDAVWNVKTYEGVVATLGSDIASSYISPSASRTSDDSLSGIGGAYPNANPAVLTAMPVQAQTPNVTTPLYFADTAFFAPGITKGTMPPGWVDTLGANFVTLDDFAWFECVDYDIWISSPDNSGVSVNPATATYNLQVADIFGALDASGNLSVVKVARTIYPVGWYPGAIGGVNNVNPRPGPPVQYYGTQIHHRCPQHIFEGDGTVTSLWSSERNTGDAVRLQYLGTAFSSGQNQNPPNTGAQVGRRPLWSVTPIARSIYRRGTCGSARIIMWQNLTAGMNMDIRGIMRTQLVATGGVAPFTTSSGDKQTINASLIPFVASLYNGPSNVFKRIYTGTEYKALASGISKDLKVMFHDRVTGLPQETLREAKAAGLGAVTGYSGAMLGKRRGPQRSGAACGKCGECGCNPRCNECRMRHRAGAAAVADEDRAQPVRYPQFKPWLNERIDNNANVGRSSGMFY